MANYLFVGGDFALKSSFRIEDPPGSGLYDFLEPGDPLPDGDDTVDAGSSSGFGSITVDKWIGGSLTAGSISANVAEGVSVEGGTLTAPEVHGVTASGTGVVNATTKMTNDPDEPVGSLIQASGGSITAPEIVNVLSLGGSANLINMSGGLITATDVYSTGTSGMANSVSGGQLTVTDYDIKSVADRTSTLNISNGGIVAITNDIAIGRRTGDETYITITGAGSDLDIGTKTLVIGEYGYGRLTIGKDADVSFAEVRTAIVDISSGPVRGGDIVVENGGNLVVTGNATIGELDDGRLDITSGGTVNIGGNLVAGQAATSRGIVKVSGANSELHVAGSFTFGDAGFFTGSLGNSGAAQGGSIIVESDFTMAAQADAFGSAHLMLIDGANSKLSVGGNATIGDAGISTLQVSGEASLEFDKSVVLGKQAGASGSIVVGGTDSLPTAPDQFVSTFLSKGDLKVGESGSGSFTVRFHSGAIAQGGLTIGEHDGSIGKASILSGGALEVATFIMLGQEKGSSGTINVSGASKLDTLRSLLVAAGNVYVGFAGTGQFSAFDNADVRFATGDMFIGLSGNGSTQVSSSATLTVKGIAIGGAAGPQASVDSCNTWSYLPDSGNGSLFVSSNAQVIVTGSSISIASPYDAKKDPGDPSNNIDLADDILVTSGGSLSIGGSSAAPANQIHVGAGASMIGHGIVTVEQDFLVKGTIVNDGTIKATEGTLKLNANVTGAGHAEIDDKASLVLNGAFEGEVDFDGGRGTRLFLNASTLYDTTATGLSFKGEIGGLADGNEIHLGPGSWGTLAADGIAHTEVVGSTLEITTNKNHIVSYQLDAPVSGHSFAVRTHDDHVSLFYAPSSSQILTHVDGTPTNGSNPFIDSLIWGWSAWNASMGPITYWFGEASDTHAAIDVHGDTQYLTCENPQVNSWTGEEKAAFEAALSVYETITGLTFQEATSVSDANLVWWLSSSLGDPGLLGLSETPVIRPDGHLWQYFVDGAWIADPDQLEFGGDGLATIIHELGHALGLSHPHDGGTEPDASRFPGVTPNAIGGSIGTGGQNQSIYTQMSYNTGWNVQPTTGPTYGNQGGLGALDIAALQLLYGANATYNSGNETYALPTANAPGTGWSAIWDTNGIDAISNAGSSLAAVIDLREAPLLGTNAGGYVSYVKGIQGGFTIANGVLIENAVGGNGSDILNGNAANNTLDGGMGADTMSGGAGNDIFIVDDMLDKVIEALNQGTDTVGSYATFVLGANVENLELFGTGNINGTGNTLANKVMGNSGNNILKGGTGIDTVSYENASGPVTISLALTTAQDNTAGGAGIDTLATFENVIGSIVGDILAGTAAANIIDGGMGADVMTGGRGNDTYFVDDLGDQVIELVGEGTDTVIIEQGGPSSFDLSAGTPWANIENVHYLGSDDVTGTGSSLANVLSGSSGADVLAGGGGNDRLIASQGAADGKSDQLIGGAGNDTFIVYEAIDVAEEASAADGVDTVESYATSYTLGVFIENLTILGGVAGGSRAGTGNGLANIIKGNISNDVLDGAADFDPLFADQLIGGLGNDTYIVRDAKDKVVEGTNAGMDTVVAHVTITALAANVENIYLEASAGNINAKGNTLANLIVGNAGDNILDGSSGIDTVSYKDAGSAVTADLTLKTATGGGGADTLLGFENIIGSDHADTLNGTAAANRIDGGLGADTMSGGAGNDTYVVDDAGDVITETAAGGTGDAVESAFDVDLTTLAGGFIEHATLTGSSFKAIGNAASNILIGNAVANQLTGGAGRDFFVFKDALGPANIDTIVDFSVLDDTIRLDNAVFTAFTKAGALATTAFTIGSAAADAADRIIYEQATGALFYDEDGSGSALQIQFAVLDAGLMLTSKDFLIV